MNDIPVITIDGPSGVGKGTIAFRLAQHLDWHYLDSGALYRTLALIAVQKNISYHDESRLCQIASQLRLTFQSAQGDRVLILYAGDDITAAIRSETCGNMASKIAARPTVRQALLQAQQDFLRSPGLVADGRDMGTVIFADARLKFFLTASAEVRAERRYRQLKNAGVGVSLDKLVREISARDHRDASRDSSPLRPASDAVTIDTSDLSIDEVFAQICASVECTGLASQKRLET